MVSASSASVNTSVGRDDPVVVADHDLVHRVRGPCPSRSFLQPHEERLGWVGGEPGRGGTAGHSDDVCRTSNAANPVTVTVAGAGAHASRTPSEAPACAETTAGKLISSPSLRRTCRCTRGQGA